MIQIGFLYYLSKQRFNAIVVHHSASWTDSYGTIKEYHRNRFGWHDAAYHLILSNGSREIPLGHLEATNRYKYFFYSTATKDVGANLNAIHLCVVGNYEEKPMPAELRPSLAHALMLLQKKYNIPDDQILFHGEDCNSSACPGKNLSKTKVLKWIKEEAGNCTITVADAHKRILRGPYFGLKASFLWSLPVLFPLLFIWLKVFGLGRQPEHVEVQASQYVTNNHITNSHHHNRSELL